MFPGQERPEHPRGPPPAAGSGCPPVSPESTSPESDDGRTAAREPRRRGWRRALAWFATALATLVSLVIILVLWVLPWLASRGDLNTIVESVIRSSIHPSLEVKISRLETDSLSRLAITFMEGVRIVGEEERFSFRCERISVLYNPIDVWFGRVRDVTMVRPDLFINLDTDVTDLFARPRPPPGMKLPERAREGERGYEIGHLGLQGARLRVRYAGRDIEVKDLGLEVFGVGSREVLAFELRSGVFGARVEARGDVVSAGERTYEFRNARASVTGLDLNALLRALFPSRLIVRRGRFDFTGTVTGTWPRRLVVDLEARAVNVEAIADGETPEGAAFQKGAADLAVRLIVHGELDRVDFEVALGADADVRLVGDGVRERVRLDLAGAYRKEGERIVLEKRSRLDIGEVGTISIDGTVESLLSEPRLDLLLATTGLGLEVLRGRSIGAWLERVVGAIGGRLSARARFTGPATEPRLALEFEVDDGFVFREDLAADLRGSVAGATLFGDAAPTIEGLRASVDGIDAALLGKVLELDPETESIAGTASLELRVPVLRPPALPDHLDVALTARVDALLAGGAVGMDRARASARATVFPDRVGSLRVEGALDVAARGLAIGRAWDPLDGEPITVAGAVEISRSGVGASSGSPVASLDLDVRSPSTGPVRVVGEIGASPRGAGEPQGARLALAISGERVPNRRFLDVYLRGALEHELPVLGGATFDGETAFDLRVDGDVNAPRVHGRVRSSGLAAELPEIGLRLASVDVDLPIDLGTPAGVDANIETGALSIGEIAFGGVEVAGVRIPVAMEGTAYRIAAAPGPLALLGGTIGLRSLRVDPAAPELEGSLSAQGLDLGQIAARAGLESLDGRIDADFPIVRIRGARIELLGELVAFLCGGEVRMRDFTIDSWSTPYATFSLGSGSIRDLDLLQVGEIFGFGLMSGVLEGSIENLVFIPGALSRFEIDLETVERSGVPQYITTSAVRNLKRAVSGPFATIEEAFFSKFRYEAFGFRASLRNNRFRLRGKYDLDGVEHIMYARWWQFPRIRIVNSRPGKDYDWRRIVSNLKRLVTR